MFDQLSPWCQTCIDRQGNQIVQDDVRAVLITLFMYFRGECCHIPLLTNTTGPETMEQRASDNYITKTAARKLCHARLHQDFVSEQARWAVVLRSKALTQSEKSSCVRGLIKLSE